MPSQQMPGEVASLVLDRVVKAYGAVEVLADVDLTVKSGEFIVFVGPSGCGKSTLLRMIAGLEEVSAGSILIDGKDVTEADPSERGIAMVFQSYALYPHLTVRENMGFSLKMAHRPKTEIEAKVSAAAEVLHLDPLLDRRPSQLSGGQRQRVAIGRAIVRNPKIFLFDEPLSNLDAELRVEMRIEIAKLHRKLGNTMIYVTHDQTEAMTLADRIVVLRGGKIEQVGSPAEIYGDPDNLFVAGFIGSPKINVLPAQADGGRVHVGGWSFVPPVVASFGTDKRALSIGVRPDSFHIAPAGTEGIPITIDFSEFLGNTTYLYGQTGDGHRVVAKAESVGELEPGTAVKLTVDPGDVLLFDAAGQRLR
ncbi:ABC transporter ATP-binding protein [Oryzibacter oryziterrae]|uniref:ABC transporter ATP-binding protein n=1 Tax=Oryzibacter oryziterrae TaxID=2766474 RepID=UPI00272BBB18|nr:ABC transporter ATP-binding protein [Oryzibacter oryziterrae]